MKIIILILFLISCAGDSKEEIKKEQDRNFLKCTLFHFAYVRYRFDNSGYQRVNQLPDKEFFSILDESFLWRFYCGIVLEDRRLKEQDKKENIFE